MTDVKWKRARQPEQKEQRRREIVAAAAQLFEQQGFDQVSLNAIAREAGLAKSNVYRYFGGREEIFLALMAEDYAEYVDALRAGLATLAGSDDISAVGAVIASAAAARPRLCALTAVLSSVIEQNISEESFVQFKVHVLEVADRIAELLQAALPSLPPQASHEFQRYLQALAAGLWPMSMTTSKFEDAMARPEFANFCVDFEADLRSSVTALLRGLHV